MSQTDTSPTDKKETADAAAQGAPGRVVMEDGIAWIHLDNPGKNVNTLSTANFEWFSEQIEALAAEPPRGAVILSDKPGYFIVGADIEELRDFTEPKQVEGIIAAGHEILFKIEKLPFPVICAIDGACLGGGLELALGCDGRVATDAAHTKLGLPEVLLGLFPGLGGTQRLPRLIGVPSALDLILTGRTVSGKKAKRLGLVDDVCHPLNLKEAASRLVARGKRTREEKENAASRSAAKRSFFERASNFIARTPGAKRLVYDKAEDTVMKKTGGHYPAPLKALEVVEKGMDMPLKEALELEAEEFAKLVVSEHAKGLISIFFTKNSVEARAKEIGKESREVDHVGILGAGFMGSGIAQGLLHKGYEVTLKDRDHESLGRGMKHCNDLFSNLVKKRKYRKVDLKNAMARLHPTVDYGGFGQLPLIIEAVFEDIDLKHKIIREVEANGREDLIFASNTSTIPIGLLAEASKRPENVIGMHFFSPVHKMQLLEIIRHEGTSDETLATTVEVGRKMGKTIIVVNDGPGFFTSRVLGPMVNEAVWCLEEGASIDQIDKAMTGWGWPVGPLALLDEVGLDIANHAGKVMLEHAGDRALPSPILKEMLDAGRKGRKGGRGFYNYKKKPKRVDKSVYELIQWDEADIADEDIIDRCWLAMLNEVAMCIEDGVISEPEDIDIGVIFGFGFPPFRGGILREADKRGLSWVVGRMEGFAERHGERLAPTQLLKDMAAKGQKFHK